MGWKKCSYIHFPSSRPLHSITYITSFTNYYATLCPKSQLAKSPSTPFNKRTKYPTYFTFTCFLHHPKKNDLLSLNNFAKRERETTSNYFYYCGHFISCTLKKCGNIILLRGYYLHILRDRWYDEETIDIIVVESVAKIFTWPTFW